MNQEFTMIPHDFLDKLYMSNFKKRQLKIILFLSRFRFGCHKYDIILSNSEFEVCGVGDNVIKKELEQLVRMNIVKILDPKEGVYNLNKDVLYWHVKSAMRDEEKQRDLRNKVIRRHIKPSFNLRDKIYPKQTAKVPNSRYQTTEKPREGNENSGAKHIGNIVKDILGKENNA